MNVNVKVLGVSGTPVTREAAKGITNTEILLNEILDSCRAEGEDVQVDGIFPIEDGWKGEGCNHDNYCLLEQTPDCICSKDDVMTQVYYSKLIECDALVLATPVYNGRMSWYLAAFIDRLRAILEGRYYGFRGPNGTPLKDKVLAVSAVAWYRNAGVESALLTTLYLTAGILGMIPVVSGPQPEYWGGFGFGAGGASQSPLYDFGGVRNDEYAMQAARNLGRRVVEVARVLKAGKAAVSRP